MSARIVAGVVTLALTQVLALRGAHAAATEATVLDAGGCVREAGATECKPASAGAMVSTQAAFVSGKDGNRVRLADGSDLALAPDTEVVLLPTTRLDLGSKGGQRGQVIQIVQGRCEVLVGGGKGTPTAVLLRGSGRLSAIAKRGSVVVRATRDSLAVANVGGLALAASGNDWGDVPVGKVRIVSKADGKGTVRDLTAAPVTTSSKNVAIAVGGPAETPVEASWLAVPGATGYEVVVRREDGVEVARRRVTDGATSTSFAGLEIGAFSATVRAVDSDGINTGWSQPAGLFVAGLVLPDGALRAQSGAVQLAPNQRVKLVAFAGLEIAMGLAWLPVVPADVGLLNGRAETLHVRQKGSTAEQSIFLEQRTTTARVELSPKNPHWPGPPVQIRVALADRTGARPPTTLKLVPRVLLDVTPVDVTWTEQDGALVTTVDNRDTGRPHVVRVEVADQFGFELGRGFVEVTPSAPAPPVK